MNLYWTLTGMTILDKINPTWTKKSVTILWSGMTILDKSNPTWTKKSMTILGSDNTIWDQSEPMWDLNRCDHLDQSDPIRHLTSMTIRDFNRCYHFGSEWTNVGP